MKDQSENKSLLQTEENHWTGLKLEAVKRYFLGTVILVKSEIPVRRGFFYPHIRG